MAGFLQRHINTGTWKANHGHYKLHFRREGDKLHSSVTYHPSGTGKTREARRISPEIVVHAPAGADRSEIMTRAGKMHHSYVTEHHRGVSSEPHYRHTYEERVDRSITMSDTTDFNDFFKSIPGGKKIKKRSPAGQQMAQHGAGNKFKNNHPNGAGKEAARVTSVRGGAQGGVQRTLAKPHKTPDMTGKSFPVMDDKAFRLTQYTLEDPATEDK